MAFDHVKRSVVRSNRKFSEAKFQFYNQYETDLFLFFMVELFGDLEEVVQWKCSGFFRNEDKPRTSIESSNAIVKIECLLFFLEDWQKTELIWPTIVLLSFLT